VLGRPIDPILAFKHFVLPGIGVEGWVEDSSKVTDTGMSKREWIGLIIHALALMDLTGDQLRIAMMLDNDDGGIVRGNSEAVYVEQTLATHRDKRYKSLLEAVEGQVENKSAKGESYAANRHLVVFCNIDGDLEEGKLAAIVAKGRFDVITIFGFAKDSRHYLAFIFDRDKSDGPIHRVAISEAKLIEAASKV
jgi:hypothetical protein